jgi:hypothetical protein
MRTSEERERAARQKAEGLWKTRDGYTTYDGPTNSYRSEGCTFEELESLCLQSEQQKDEIAALKARVEELEKEKSERDSLLKMVIMRMVWPRKTRDGYKHLGDILRYCEWCKYEYGGHTDTCTVGQIEKLFPPPSPIGEKGKEE